MCRARERTPNYKPVPMINPRGSVCSALGKGTYASNRSNDGSDVAVTNSDGATSIFFSFHLPPGQPLPGDALLHGKLLAP